MTNLITSRFENYLETEYKKMQGLPNEILTQKHSNYICEVALSDSKYIATACLDKKLKILEILGKNIAFSQDSKYIATACLDKKLKILEILKNLD